MPERNLCKKDKSEYTKMIHKENSDRLNKKRSELKADATEEEKIELEKKYLREAISFIETVVSNELKKRIARLEDKGVSKFYHLNQTLGHDGIKHKLLLNLFRRILKIKRKYKESDKLYYLNELWEDTNSRLKLAFNLCKSLDELREASDRICEIVSLLPCKDIRTYNMLPVWKPGKQSMVVNLAVQNYELVIDDFLNKLGSKGIAKLSDSVEKDYIKREELDLKLEKSVLSLDRKKILKSLRDGAYVDLKLEADEFDFRYKPCTVFNYVLMNGMDDLAIDILRYGADTNIKSMKNDGEVFLPILYALEKGNVRLIISILNAGATLNKEFIGKDIRELFRKSLRISSGLSNLKKLSESTIEEAYINDLISLEEIKEVLKKDENKILMKALRDNNSVLVSKLLSLGVKCKKDKELSHEIERYLNLGKGRNDFADFFEASRFLNISCIVPREEIMVSMYVRGLLSIDRIIDIYRKNKKYVLDRILQLGSELLFFNFLKGVPEKDKLDKQVIKSIQDYIKKTKNEELIMGMYMNGIISIDVMSDVLGKDITYFLQNAINKGNDMLIIKLLDSGANACKNKKDMAAIIALVKNYLEEDKEKYLESGVKLANKVSEYERLIVKEDNSGLEKEKIYDDKGIAKNSVDVRNS